MGFTEIVFILIIYLLLFGAKGMPSLARNMGKAMKEVRRATGDIQREIMDGAKDIKREFETDHRAQPRSTGQNPVDQPEKEDSSNKESTEKMKPDQLSSDKPEDSSSPETDKV